jgi:hypothetical protein
MMGKLSLMVFWKSSGKRAFFSAMKVLVAGEMETAR